METTFDQLFNTLTDKVKSMANTQTVIGEEFTIGEFTCKPVIKVGLGFGGGVCDGKSKHHKSDSQNSTGGGAGMGISPVGFLVAKGDELSFIPSNDKKGLSGLLEKMPDLLEKAMEMKKKQDEKKD